MTLSAILALAAAFQALRPAFLDDWDEIRVWIPQAARLSEIGKVEVRLGGKPFPVRAIEGGEPATPENDPDLVTLPGTFQSLLGGKDWDPAGAETRMAKVGEEVYEVDLELPAGTHEFKIARGGSWSENYGEGFQPNGSNLKLSIPFKQWVRFRVDFRNRTLATTGNSDGSRKPPATTPRPAAFQSVKVRLVRDLKPAEISLPLQVRVAGGPWREVFARQVLDAPEFHYLAGDLGNVWTPKKTTFKVWSPVARRVDLALFQGDRLKREVPMKRLGKGVWGVEVPGNLHGVPYQYRLESYGVRRTAADIYARAATQDSSKSVVVDLSKTNPPGWPAPRVFAGRQPVDAVLYEIHIRDYTIQAASGIKPEWRGKYLGLTEAGTRVPGTDFPTGLDYLKALGATHVHLLPFQDFNPGNSKVYNWGYETTLFNVPEEQYSIAPEDPLARIREVKEMVFALQKAGIGVVLDVVYNHSVPSEGPGSAFWELVPYFYFRTNDRGDVLNESGVGNALHDGRTMVRKFISDSLDYWAREYRIDGFRFDLIGMFERESNRHFAARIRKANPHAVIYGEPWTGGGPIRFGKGDQRGTGVAVFNDLFRNAVRGELDGPGPGFGTGGTMDRQLLETIVRGSTSAFADSPQESVNYVSAHDNLTFRDKVALSMPQAGVLQREAAVRLSHAVVLLSQGIPFLEGGVEIGRTKGMNANSYNAGDEANQFDWSAATAYRDTFKYFQGLIQLRKAHPAFRLRTKAEVDRALRVLDGPIFGFRLDGAAAGDPWKEILVYFNHLPSPQTVALPAGTWSQAVDGRAAGIEALRTATDSATLDGYSAAVFFKS